MAHDTIPSRAAIKGHPLHPVFIPFPIAFGTSVVFTDVAYWVTDAREWAVASVWLIWAAVGTGVIAGALGAVDYLGIAEVRKHRQATQHAVGNIAVLALLAVNGLWRIGDVEAVVVPWGVAVSVITAGLLGFTGYLGGELSYKHLIGGNPQQSEPDSPVLGSRTNR